MINKRKTNIKIKYLKKSTDFNQSGLFNPPILAKKVEIKIVKKNKLKRIIKILSFQINNLILNFIIPNKQINKINKLIA